MVRVNINKDLSGIKKRTGQMKKQGQYALVNQVHADMNNYVPAKSFDLRNLSSVTLDGKAVHYNVPYARKQFYVPHVNYTTPGTGPRWDNKAKSIHSGSWERVVTRAMR